MKDIIKTENAPAAIGPYSQAVKVTGGEMLFCSGQIPINPETGNIDSTDVITQARQVMHNLIQVITTAGFSLREVVKTTIYLTDLSSFAQVNEIYASFFESDFRQVHRAGSGSPERSNDRDRGHRGTIEKIHPSLEGRDHREGVVFVEKPGRAHILAQFMPANHREVFSLLSFCNTKIRMK